MVEQSPKRLFDSISVVLVRPEYSGNIGAAARAMKNMGFCELVLVNPYKFNKDEAIVMASGADDIIENARFFSDLKEALDHYGMVVGTSRRIGKKRKHFYPIDEVIEKVVEFSNKNRVAIVFGPEKTGLTNRDLDLCHLVTSIPTSKEFGSLNLAQAVLLFLYELFRSSEAKKPLVFNRKLATSFELEGMFSHIEQILKEIRFLEPDNPDRMMSVIRFILGRASLNSREVRIIRGICRQINWYINKNKEGKDVL